MLICNKNTTRKLASFYEPTKCTSAYGSLRCRVQALCKRKICLMHPVDGPVQLCTLLELQWSLSEFHYTPSTSSTRGLGWHLAKIVSSPPPKKIIFQPLPLAKCLSNISSGDRRYCWNSWRDGHSVGSSLTEAGFLSPNPLFDLHIQ